MELSSIHCFLNQQQGILKMLSHWVHHTIVTQFPCVPNCAIPFSFPVWNAADDYFDLWQSTTCLRARSMCSSAHLSALIYYVRKQPHGSFLQLHTKHIPSPLWTSRSTKQTQRLRQHSSMCLLHLWQVQIGLQCTLVEQADNVRSLSEMISSEWSY